MMQSEAAFMLAQVNSQADLTEHNIYSEFNAYFNASGWPDMLQVIETRDFVLIAEQARDFARKLEGYLIANGVPRNVFETLEEAQAYLCSASA